MSISIEPISINPGKIKAIAIDLDGTLLAPGRVLSERAIKAIEKCRRKGIQVIISTGRSIESAECFRAALAAEGPMVYLNGALVADVPQAKVLSIVPLAATAAELCVDLAREKGVYCQLYISGDNSSGSTTLMAEMDCPEREQYFEHTRLMSELVDLKKTLRRTGPDSCIKCMFLADPEKLSELRQRLEERLGKSVYIALTLWNFMEVMDAKVSKGTGLKFLMELKSWKAEEVIAIGDEENDLPMFEVAGFSVAPASAKDSVKARADLVVGSNADDGVAVFLEELFGF